jgi:hypothetical protein
MVEAAIWAELTRPRGRPSPPGRDRAKGESDEILMAVRKLSRGRSYAFDRALIELAKTMDLNEIAKKTGRVPAGILKTDLLLGIRSRGRRRRGNDGTSAQWNPLARPGPSTRRPGRSNASGTIRSNRH